MAEPKHTLVEKLFEQHSDALQAFFYRRVRAKPDAADLAQEVYLRILRVADPDAIRNPEAYLFTVAANLLKENAVANRRKAELIEADDGHDAEAPANIDGSLDTSRRIERLRVVLGQLPLKCQAAVLLQYRHGLSYQEIALRLDVSPHMVKKYLGQALTQCRRRMMSLR
jgi:RNA polymerase sigma-70 factor (ECF subfamily)